MAELGLDLKEIMKSSDHRDQQLEASVAIKYLKRLMSSHIGYPHFSHAYARDHIARAHTQAKELEEYEQCARAQKLCPARCLMIASSLLFFVKICSRCYVTISQVNLINPEKNIQQADASLTRFTCLLTNCTTPLVLPEELHNNFRWSSEQLLGLSLIDLPHFNLCHAYLAYLPEPSEHLGHFGLVASSTIAFTSLLCGVILPIMHRLRPTGNLLMMFLVAPQATRRVVYDRAKRALHELEQSYVNFVQSMREIERSRRKRRHRYLDTPFQPHFSNDPYDRTRLNVRTLEMYDGETLEEKAADCVSVMRSNWWHSISSRTLISLMVIISSASVLLYLVACGLVSRYVRERQARLARVGVHMRQQLNCSIWRHDDEQLIDLEHYVMHLNGWLAFCYFLQFGWSMGAATIQLVLYLLTNTELACWLQETQFELQLANEFIRQLAARDKSTMRAEESSGGFQMEWLREQFKLACNERVRVPFVRHNLFAGQSSRLRASKALELFVRETIASKQLSLWSGIELLTKLHVNLRLFLEHVHHYGPTMALIIVFVHLFTYGYIIIGIWWLRSITNYTLVPSIVMAYGWLMANFLILLACYVHAKAKQLHPLIWSLLASTSGCQEPRLRHLRLVWLKQVQALDRDGGLALKAFGVRITYVRMLQLLLGSGTLVVYAQSGYNELPFISQ